MPDSYPRQDEQGRTYYEARAGSQGGCRGGKAPNIGYTAGGFALPKQVRVIGASWWRIRGDGPQVYADGSGETGSTGGPVIFPGAPPWSLIACWVATRYDGKEVRLAGPFYVGKEAVLNVPLITPSSIGSGSWGYDPGVYLRYWCNDEFTGFWDNDGYIHVYEQWL